jgi:hypothetical protein
MVMEDLNKKTKRNILLLLVAVVLASGIIFFGVKMFQVSKENQKQADYIIQGVPYIGLYNNVGNYSFTYVLGDVSKTMASILEYWNPGRNNLTEVGSCLYDLKLGRFVNFTDVQNCISKFGEYKFETLHLHTDELKKYVNSGTKTPLLFFLPVSIDQPLEVAYAPPTLLIGVEDSQKKVILHSFWFGNNYEMSFDDFDKLWERMRPEGRNNYLAVQPKNLQNKLKEINSRKIVAYPARTSIMIQAHSMFQNFALGWGAQQKGLNDMAQNYYSDILNDPKFDAYFPPYFKVNLFTKLAEVYFVQDNIDQALISANRAVELNHDLDKPFKDWPGCELVVSNKADRLGESSDAYRILGDVYQKQKNYQSAMDNYQKSLEINTRNLDAYKGFIQTKLELAGGTK